MKMVECSFTPQVWVNDDAIDVDPQGPGLWIVSTGEIEALTGVADLSLLDEDPCARDELRHAKSAPGWVKEWSGPFCISWEVVK